MESRYFFVFCYGFGSFGVAADTLKEAREIFRKRIEGDLDLSGSIPPASNRKRRQRYKKQVEKFAESGIDIDSIEPEIYQ
jgi:hypothetical protein